MGKRPSKFARGDEERGQNCTGQGWGAGQAQQRIEEQAQELEARMEGRDDMEETTMQSSAPAFGTDALADTISLVEKHTMTFHEIFVPG